ncbi:hypothetical protein CYANOKiyG1_43330 [Okeania sp. KiyG1]|nr:hypothetical protein CYANOKiyG1_43330 [Okeania sp. KiyG1]
MIDFFTCNLPSPQGESMFLVQEYIEGDNLKYEFKNNQRNGTKWNQTEVINFLIDILGILEYLQTKSISEKKLIHRDLHPANLIRGRQDRKIYLIDFGLVKLIALNYSRDLLSATICGNGKYSAPEQIKGKINFCSDIYSVGFVAIEGLIGKHPLSNHGSSETVKWQDLLSEVDRKISNVLIKMVEHDPTKRYQSAMEVLADLEPFKMLGKTLKNNTYRIKNYLGSGRFGNTYLAENIEESQTYPYVIKQLKLEKYKNLNKIKTREKFKYEVAALTLLGSGSYNRIPKLRDSFEESGGNNISDQPTFYLVQEYIEGEDIRQELSKKNWNQNQVIEFLHQLLEILNFIHSHSVIHCDIKPSNIMRRFSDEKFVLIDFGSVKKAVIFSENIGQYNSSESVGTIGYMSPEQAQGNEQIGCNSDIYALGITAIQALTGKEPNQLGLRDKKTGKYNWSNNIQVNNKLVRILDKMVDFDHVRRRYNSAQEVLNDLGRLKGKNIIEFQSLIKRKFWMVGTIFGVIVLSILILGLIIFVGDSKYQESFNKGMKLLNKANKLEKEGKSSEETYQNALRFFEQALDISPNDVHSLINKGYIFSKLNQPEESEKSCQAALEIAEVNDIENQAKANNCIGVSLSQQNKYKDANGYYEDAITINPEYIESWSNRGYTLMQWGYDIEEKGNNSEAYKTYLLAEDFIKSALRKIENNRASISKDDNNFEIQIRLMLGEVFFRQGKVLTKMNENAKIIFDKSEESYNEALDLTNKDNLKGLKARILLARAKVFYELSKFEAALRDCQKVQQLEREIEEGNLKLKTEALNCQKKLQQ